MDATRNTAKPSEHFATRSCVERRERRIVALTETRHVIERIESNQSATLEQSSEVTLAR